MAVNDMKQRLSRFAGWMGTATRVLGLAVLAGVAAPAVSRAQGPDFWVWQRTQRLDARELGELQRLRTASLFWHAGTLQPVGDRWKWAEPRVDPSPIGAGMHVVPVVRIESGKGDSGDPFSLARSALLAGALRAAANAAGELQIDFDCPDRLLDRYAAFLAALRKEVPRLSITALPHWSRTGAWEKLQAAVAEMAPMFYDLQADPLVSAEAPPPPLLDPQQIEPILEDWSRCRIPWRAGLPAFSRLTVFDANGRTRGQVPGWAWGDLCFNRHLRHIASHQPGVTLLRADAGTRIGRFAITENEWVAARSVERESLARTINSALRSGASGIVLFRLPNGRDADGPSLSDLASLATDEKPLLRLARSGSDGVVLTNHASVDLGPRLRGSRHDRDRGYMLEIDAPGPIFREAVPGDFWRVAAHASPDTARQAPVPVPLATRLTFWFASLPAGRSLATGLVQFAPGANLTGVRYRILDTEDSSWRDFPQR